MDKQSEYDGHLTLRLKSSHNLTPREPSSGMNDERFYF